MVVKFNDEPEIFVGGAEPIATDVPATAFNNTNKNIEIERVTNADGSLTVKATTTSRQSNGYMDVTIEYFYVPANMAGAVSMSMDSTGEPPSSLYMTKMEQQVLPPGTGEVVSHAPSVVPQATAATTGTGGAYSSQPYIHEDTVEVSSNSSRGCAICCGVCLLIIAILSIIGVVTRLSNKNNYTWTPAPAPYWPSAPAPYDWPDNIIPPLPPIPPLPGPRPPFPIQRPTPWPTQPSSCRDTPSWTDQYGHGCGSYFDLICPYFDGGEMGPASEHSEHCCVCGGGTVPSTPSKSPATSGSAVPSISNVPAVVPSTVSKDTKGLLSEMDSSTSNSNPFRSPTAAKED